jgi:hypothetical protein
MQSRRVSSGTMRRIGGRRSGPNVRNFGMELPGGQCCSKEAEEGWLKLLRRHAGRGARLCELRALLQDVFRTEVWSGGQMSWWNEAEVRL